MEFMNDPEVFNNRCGLCGKRKAERLCDYIVDYTGVVFYRNTFDFLNQDRHETCDLPMCTECTTKYNGHDFCPHHVKMHKLAKNQPTEKLQKARQYERQRQLSEHFKQSKESRDK